MRRLDDELIEDAKKISLEEIASLENEALLLQKLSPSEAEELRWCQQLISRIAEYVQNNKPPPKASDYKHKKERMLGFRFVFFSNITNKMLVRKGRPPLKDIAFTDVEKRRLAQELFIEIKKLRLEPFMVLGDDEPSTEDFQTDEAEQRAPRNSTPAKRKDGTSTAEATRRKNGADQNTLVKPDVSPPKGGCCCGAL